MLHHLSFAISNLQRAAKFYDAVLGALGYVRAWTAADAVGYGREEGQDKFAIKAAPDVQTPSPGFHLAFEARSRQSVDDFYRAALEHGGSDNGAPGLRPQYGPNYYAAFVRDPDGYRIEAVFISREAAP
jgi:catechol 2,3-dioxygenase-like lactoylglutathione lyase family enzyme